jgi:hypothetical protein
VRFTVNSIRTRLQPDDERGMALITVMLTVMVVTLLVVTSIDYATSSQKHSRRDQDWNAALPAAEAGIDDYLTRMNKNDTYVQFNSATKLDPDNGALSPVGAPAFVPIPGRAGEGEFSYEVDTSDYVLHGVIHVTSTGRVRDTERTVSTSLRREGFIDYLYFTDYETRDPALYSAAVRTFLVSRGVNCAKHFWDPTRDALCENNDLRGTAPNQFRLRNSLSIQFADGDVMNGPAHSNDAMRMAAGDNGPRFLGDLTTSFNTGARWLRGDGTQPPTSGPRPRFHRTGDPAYEAPKVIPETNGALVADAIANGCLFTGPTSVRLLPDGRMAVRSPFTKDTNPGRPPAQKCWAGAGTSHPLTTERVMKLPRNGVLVVQNVPTSGPNAGSCPASGHPLGYPRTGDVTPYGCLNGDAFVEGVLDGRLTVAADNDVVITWDLIYKDGLTGVTADDMLGLIASNNVAIYHPVTSSGQNIDVRTSGCRSGGDAETRCTFRDPVVQAAILSLKHSFTVQNFANGAPLGDLTVNGSISQRFRGPVGTTGPTGYLKEYAYDTRMKKQGPPRFLEPVGSPWGVVRWEER